MNLWVPNPKLTPKSYRVGNESHRYYPTPDGELVGTTTVLSVWGAGSNAIANWMAAEERKATLEAVSRVHAEGRSLDPAQFVEEVEKRLGVVKAGIRALNKAGDIGSKAHEYIAWLLHRELGSKDPEPEIPGASMVAVMAFKEFWKDARLKPLAMEEQVWDKTFGYAGTVDLIAENAQGELIIVDFKTSKYVYDKFHMQVAAYLNAARNFAAFGEGAGLILRLPKSLDDPGFQVVKLGKLYDRDVSEHDLRSSFLGLLDSFNIMVADPKRVPGWMNPEPKSAQNVGR